MEKRREWAAGRRSKSETSFERARVVADGIPLGQPILVGHHSEKRHRKDVERIDNGMRNGVEHLRTAQYHESKAAGLEAQLDGSIFSDDPDALERLDARIAELERTRDAWKAENAAFRKGPATFAACLQVSAEARSREIRARIMEGYSWCRQPHPTYSLTNLGANIRRLKERRAAIAERQRRTAAAEAAPGGVTIESRGGGYCRVTFAEKPEREVLTALREAGFRWGGGSWTGLQAKLPKLGDEAHTHDTAVDCEIPDTGGFRLPVLGPVSVAALGPRGARRGDGSTPGGACCDACGYCGRCT